MSDAFYAFAKVFILIVAAWCAAMVLAIVLVNLLLWLRNRRRR